MVFCSVDVLLKRCFDIRDVLVQGRFVWRRFVKETFSKETFCMCVLCSHT